MAMWEGVEPCDVLRDKILTSLSNGSRTVSSLTDEYTKRTQIPHEERHVQRVINYLENVGVVIRTENRYALVDSRYVMHSPSDFINKQPKKIRKAIFGNLEMELV